MDEVSFGSSREPRRLPRRLRALGAAGSIAAAAAAAIAIAVTASAHHGAVSPVPAPAGQSPMAVAVPVPALEPLSAVCPPAQPTFPDLGALPVSLRPGALKVIVNGQFSGHCPAPR